MRVVKLVPILAMAGALAACAAVKGADTPVTMRLSPSFAPASALVAGSIAVAPVQARGVTAAARYAYVDAAAPGEIRQAKTFFWEEAPPRLVERALVAGLRSRFATVSGPEVNVPAERRVVAVLDRFEELSAGADSRAVVAFDANMVSSGRIERTGRYCGSAPITGAGATDRARAFEAAVQTAVSALVAEATGGQAAQRGSC